MKWAVACVWFGCYAVCLREDWGDFSIQVNIILRMSFDISIVYFYDHYINLKMMYMPSVAPMLQNIIWK